MRFKKVTNLIKISVSGCAPFRAKIIDHEVFYFKKLLRIFIVRNTVVDGLYFYLILRDFKLIYSFLRLSKKRAFTSTNKMM
jgi:hypothetical protein